MLFSKSNEVVLSELVNVIGHADLFKGIPNDAIVDVSYGRQRSGLFVDVTYFQSSCNCGDVWDCVCEAEDIDIFVELADIPAHKLDGGYSHEMLSLWEKVCRMFE